MTTIHDDLAAVMSRIKRWTTKAKRAQTALVKLEKQKRRLERKADAALKAGLAEAAKLATPPRVEPTPKAKAKTAVTMVPPQYRKGGLHEPKATPPAPAPKPIPADQAREVSALNRQLSDAFFGRGLAAQKAVDAEVAAANDRIARKRKPRRTPDDFKADIESRK